MLKNKIILALAFLLAAALTLPNISAAGWWANMADGGTYIYNYTNNATFEVPDGVTSLEIIVIGGGGGGCTSNSAGGGGSGGNFRRNTSVAVTPRDNLTIVIGLGGIGAATGQDGGNTTVRVNKTGQQLLIEAAGGGGGTVAANRSQYGTSSVIGGTVTGGDGGAGGTASGNAGCGGGGGAGGWNGQGGAGGAVGANNGVSSTAAGGGGGGGSGTGSARCGGGGGTGVFYAFANILNNGTGGGTSTTQAAAGSNGSQGNNGTAMSGGNFGGGGAGDDVGGLTTGNGGNGTVVIKFKMPSICTNYSGTGNWQIPCHSNCTTSKSVSIASGGNVTINGTGIVIIQANIYNWKYASIFGTNTNGKCFVFCVGGCLTKGTV